MKLPAHHPLKAPRPRNNIRILNYTDEIFMPRDIFASVMPHENKRNEPEVVSHCNIELKYLKN